MEMILMKRRQKKKKNRMMIKFIFSENNPAARVFFLLTYFSFPLSSFLTSFFRNGMKWNFPLGIPMLLLAMMMVLGSLNKKDLLRYCVFYTKLLIYQFSHHHQPTISHCFRLYCIYLCSSINIKLLSCWLSEADWIFLEQSE